MEEATLLRFRTAMKFTLWAWALYWPGGGIVLLGGGMDGTSLIVGGLALAGFAALVAMGGLRATSSRNMKEFFLERPLYLLAGFVVLVLVASMVSALENIGLALFSTLYVAAIGLAVYRLWEHVKASDESLMQMHADQALVAFGLGGLCAVLVALDAWAQLLGATGLGMPAMAVALANIAGLLYPAVLMVGTKRLREPLRKPRLKRSKEAPVPGDAVVDT